MESKILEQIEYTRVDGGGRKAAERIIKETALTIRIGGKHYTTAMILAVMEREFVLGHLLTQGVIKSAREIRSLTIRNYVAEVALIDTYKKQRVSRKVSSKFKVKQNDIINCVRAVNKSDLFSETEAVHCAGLFVNGSEPVCITEDLGRHNALDKAIGYGLLHNVDFTSTIAAVTGKQPSEMIVKCRNVNIPVIATRSVPTTLAIETAEKAGITLIGLVRGKDMVVFTHPEKIA